MPLLLSLAIKGIVKGLSEQYFILWSLVFMMKKIIL